MYLGADYYPEHWEKERWSVDAELITLEKAESLAEYRNSWHASYAAVTVNSFENGKAYYLGYGLPQGFYDEFTEEILEDLTLEGIRFSDEVEIAIREKNSKKFIFVIKFSDKSSKIFLSKEYEELMKRKKLKGETSLAPFEVLNLA